MVAVSSSLSQRSIGQVEQLSSSGRLLLRSGRTGQSIPEEMLRPSEITI